MMTILLFSWQNSKIKLQVIVTLWQHGRNQSVNALLFVSELVAVPKWKEVCTHLGVPQKELTHAEQTFPLGTEGDPARRFKCGLEDWYGGNCKIDGVPVPVTNGMLCKALEECRYCAVSKELFKRRKSIDKGHLV